MENKMTLGEKLRTLRAISGWTQPECAERIGIEQSYLSKLENDKSIPSAEIFDALCAAYKVSPDEVIKDLDKAYVRKNLMHIPIVSASASGNTENIKRKRKGTVILCSTFILVALLFFFISYLELLSSNQRYEYHSLGVDFKHEINRCLKTRKKDECYIKYTGEYDSTPTPFKDSHNWIPDSFITTKFQGRAIHKELPEGFRDYHVKKLDDKRSLVNSLFMILSVFMAALGVLGLIVEARFYQIDKQ